MSIRRLAVPAVSAAALVAAGATVAAAAMTGGAHGNAHENAHGNSPAQQKGGAIFLAASLNGGGEVPVSGGPGVGDRDGRAVAVLRLQGDRLWYALRWQDVAAPTAGHLHLGAAGTNGAVEVPLFAGTLPGTARAVTGTVRITDKATLDRLRDDPGGLHANLHTGEAPGGAVRGRLHRLSRPADLNGVLNGAAVPELRSLADGAQDVPAADGRATGLPDTRATGLPDTRATGDPDGRATGFARVRDGLLAWGFTWSSIAPPTLGHVHEGARGRDGAVVADLFAAPAGLPAPVTGIAGVSRVAPGVAHRIARGPGGFYTDLHTGEFPGGAVRGQLAPASDRPARAFTRAVVAGAQVYRCTRQPSGGYAFTQDNVAAVLEGGIRHMFARPGPAGPPRWVAADGGAVTGRAVTKTPNGAGNIPELVLDATPVGEGLLSGTTQILRLNTAGGVAPSGACDPSAMPLTKVPYRADYVFLG